MDNLRSRLLKTIDEDRLISRGVVEPVAALVAKKGTAKFKRADKSKRKMFLLWTVRN